MVTNILRKAIAKAAEKIVKTDPADAITQMNADDVVTIIKAILF